MSDDPIVQNAALTGENMLLRVDRDRLAKLHNEEATHNLSLRTELMGLRAERDRLAKELAEALERLRNARDKHAYGCEEWEWQWVDNNTGRICVEKCTCGLTDFFARNTVNEGAAAHRENVAP